MQALRRTMLFSREKMRQYDSFYGGDNAWHIDISYNERQKVSTVASRHHGTGTRCVRSESALSSRLSGCGPVVADGDACAGTRAARERRRRRSKISRGRARVGARAARRAVGRWEARRVRARARTCTARFHRASAGAETANPFLWKHTISEYPRLGSPNRGKYMKILDRDYTHHVIN